MNIFTRTVLIALSIGILSAFAADVTIVPVKSVTVFKDGYAFVQHEWTLPVNKDGTITLDQLPAPVLGTFWSYVAQDGVTLKSVVAKRERVKIDRTALSLQELIIANPGAACTITEINDKTYGATLGDVPMRAADDRDVVDGLPTRGNIVLLKTDAGIKVLPIDRIRDITFAKEPARANANEEFRNRLELKLDWADKPPAASVKIGFMYLQRGLRWIPNYKVDLDGAGKARLDLQATLVNELIDFDSAPVNLVVGVPNIEFRDMVDPLSLQSALVRTVQQAPNQPMFSNLSNAIMTQTDSPAPPAVTSAAGSADLGPDVADTETREELFVFTVKNVSLKRGERMVVPVASYSASYEDVFALDVPLTIPVENSQNQFQGSNAANRAARQLAEPKVMHRARVTNGGNQPFTTAPALIMKNGGIMSQTMMTYTAPSARVDLDITAAVDVQVMRNDQETKRTMNALTVQNTVYNRVDMHGALALTSFHSTPITLEVKRRVVGASDSVSQDGTTRSVNPLTEGLGNSPWYQWATWVREVNGIAEFSWKIKLDPKNPVTLDHAWHYFWR